MMDDDDDDMNDNADNYKGDYNVDDDNDNDNDDDNCWAFLSAIARENSSFRLKKGHEMLPPF